MADQRQAELGRQVAEHAPEWAVRAWGRPPAQPGALRDDWQRRAGLVGHYREVAGITDPAQAIGPVPSAQPDLAEMFHASVRALQLPDEAALLKAMGQGELEADVDEHDRAIALAPADVQAEIDEREAEVEGAQVRAHIAGGVQDGAAQAQAEAEAQAASADLARLAVADAARREWAEAHAGLAARAEAAERELRSRGLAERIPVTDAEVAEASEKPRPFPEIDPADAARWKAEQTAGIEAYRRAEAEKWADRIPVTDAEVEAARRRDAEPEVVEPMSSADWWVEYYQAHPEFNAEHADPEPHGSGDREASPERAAGEADLAEVRAELERVGELVDHIPDPAAERRAEMAQAGIDEPVVHEPQAEPSLEASWQPGNAQGQYEPQPEGDYEPEMEL